MLGDLCFSFIQNDHNHNHSHNHNHNHNNIIIIDKMNTSQDRDNSSMVISDEEIGKEEVKSNTNNNNNEDDLSHLYKDFPLLELLKGSREIRRAAFKKSGSIIDKAVKSNDGWMRTIFVIRERAIDRILLPWIIVTVHAIIWSIVMHFYEDKFAINVETVTSLYNLVLTTALAFLLVFRLNRVAVRWWDTRTMWGTIVADVRILSSCILEYTDHNPKQRDDAISWLACFVVSIKQHLREDKTLNRDEVSGFIDSRHLLSLERKTHPCLCFAANLRHTLKKAFAVTIDTPTSLSVVYTAEIQLMEKYINNLINLMGGLERVKSTPLPMVFVTHLRTFLMVYLLTMPYLYAPVFKLATIPAVSVTAFILLGIDGGASECESPFRIRSNHLHMEKYCASVLDNMEDLYIENALRRCT